MATAFVGDRGTILRVNCGEDVSIASVHEFYLLKPKGERVILAAVFETDGINGILKYVVQDGDFDEPGTWQIQAHLVTATGDWVTAIGTFELLARLH